LIYLDTSVLVAYYYPEPLSETVQKLVRAQTQPFISSLNEVELLSALSRKIREGGLSAMDGERIAALFSEHVGDGLYRRIPISEQHYKMAQDWLRDFQTALRSLDALHLAVAAAAGLQLVTADKAFASAATSLGIATQFLSAQD
jgi:predicted nucleic acid-binding protein